MLNTFITASINNVTIYIKVNTVIMEVLFDVMYDEGYTIKKLEKDEWEDGLEFGISYEIDTIEEIEEFKENNINFSIKKHETES